MEREHHYKATIEWAGNLGSGTSGYKAYDRAHTIDIAGKTQIAASSDPNFRGDPAKHNPEDLLLSSISGCHMLWYLHFCAVNGIIVTAYRDNAEGTLTMEKDGKGRFTSITLKPQVTITDPAKRDQAIALHHDANAFCFIAQSVNFPVGHEAEILIAE